ncbi:MAG TPA: hypothetical protein H9858_10685 [Candidatus Blautia stercoravium]|nr:hypothetical protein [Candidatus Blautia stercoravium]
MKKICISSNWNFSTPEESGKEQTVDLPHTWYLDEKQYRGQAVYRKHIILDALCPGNLWESRTLFLEIEAADHTVRAVVNGKEIGLHKGGYSTVHFEIPSDCVCGDGFDLELHVDNRAGDEVSPLAGDFTVFGGLYRGVNLLLAEKTHFDYLYYGTDGVIVHTSVDEEGQGILKIEPHVVCAEPENSVTVRYTVLDQEGNVVSSETGNGQETVSMRLKEIQLWNGKEDLCLYTVRAELICENMCVDRVEKTVGFRAIHLDSREGFYLNGEHLFLRGVAKHQDSAGCFSAVTEREIDRDFELVCEIGANAVRLSHYQHSQHTYDICDREGYVVWAEIPMLKMTEKKETMDNATQQLKELILQNIHHPSICFWGIQNEIGMFRDAPYIHRNVSELYEIAKKLDPDRIVTCANLYPMKSKSMLNRLTDMVGYNIYFGWYYGKMQDYGTFLDRMHQELPQVPLGISEYGVDAQTWLHSETPMVKDYSEEFQSLFHETVYPMFEQRNYLWGSFVWNMFDFSSSRRDEGGQKYRNTKGLVTYDRKTRKDAFYYYKARWSEEPFLHICEQRFVKRASDRIKVRVYTNLKKVELRFSGQGPVLGENDGNGTVLFENLPLEKGKNLFTVTGYTEGGTLLKEQAVFERTETPEPSYVLPDSHAGETVQNWFLEEEGVDLDQYFSVQDRAEDLMENEECRRILGKYLPEVTELLEKEIIPLGLSLNSIISHSKKEGQSIDVRALNGELMRVAK